MLTEGFGGMKRRSLLAVVVGRVPWMFAVSSIDRVILGLVGPGRPLRLGSCYLPLA